MRTPVREIDQGSDETVRLDIAPASSSATNVAVPCAWVAVEDGQIAGLTMIDEDRATMFAAFGRP